MLIILFGFLCGLALGLTGGGGSILAVPLLVYGLKVPFEQAVTISLLVVGLMALAGVLPRIKAREIEFSVVTILASVGILIAPLGTMISTEISSAKLLVGFSVLMILVGLWGIVKQYLFNKNSNNDRSVDIPIKGSYIYQ